MKIVCLKGGLGNQMFEYCRFRDLMESGNDKVYLFYAETAQWFEAFRLF